MSLTAFSSTGAAEVDERARDLSHGVANGEVEVGELGVAGEGEGLELLVELGTGNLAVVGLDDDGVGEEESGTSVSNGVETLSGGLLLTVVDREGLARELPEAVGAVDGNLLQVTLELGLVDGTELVGTDGVVAEIGSEDGLGQGGGDVVEEGLSLLGLNGVKLGKGKTKETIVGLVLDEGLGHLGGQQDEEQEPLDAE